MLSMCLALGCQLERRKSDAELGLNPQQARGRRIYDFRCDRCHEAYSSRSKNGPALQGLFRNRYLPSGAPANDERVREAIVAGRSDMPDFGRVLSDQQIDDLMAYLHTL